MNKVHNEGRRHLRGKTPPPVSAWAVQGSAPF